MTHQRIQKAARRHWPAILATAVMSALAINVWIQNGGWVLLLIGAISIGCTLVVLASGGTSGYLVVKHSKDTQRAIEAREQRKELAR